MQQNFWIMLYSVRKCDWGKLYYLQMNRLIYTLILNYVIKTEQK
jgi:hypothetical protein